MEVFISWSGDDSKVVAAALKTAIEDFFSDNGITAFMSESDIGAGKNWYQEIKGHLTSSKIGILCLTPSNTEAPWLWFEAGAMAMAYDEKDVIPLLLGIKTSEGSPLSQKNYVTWSHHGFCEILQSVAKACEIKISNKRIKASSKGYFDDVNKTVEEIINKTKRQVPIGKKQMYPRSIGYILKGSVFLCGPMASLPSDDAYRDSRQLMQDIAEALYQVGMSPTYYGGKEIFSVDDFEESIKSVKNNFQQFKKSECVLVVYPEPLTSSVLVEIGYAIALTKPMVIFTKSSDDLPFLLKEIDKSLTTVNVFEYKNSQDILKKIRGNGVDLFPRE